MWAAVKMITNFGQENYLGEQFVPLARLPEQELNYKTIAGNFVFWCKKSFIQVSATTYKCCISLLSYSMTLGIHPVF